MDDEIIEALHERPLQHPAIEEEHDKSKYHTSQEITNQTKDEIEEDLAINDPEYAEEASSHSESISQEYEECMKQEALGLREECEGEVNQAPTGVPLILHEDVELTMEEENEKENIQSSLYFSKMKTSRYSPSLRFSTIRPNRWSKKRSSVEPIFFLWCINMKSFMPSRIHSHCCCNHRQKKSASPLQNMASGFSSSHHFPCSSTCSLKV